jgi:hypothetical protein
MSDDFFVNGLPVPQLLLSLLQQGKWKHPGDAALRRVIPFLEEDMIFLPMTLIRAEARRFSSDRPSLSEATREISGLGASHAVELPWLNTNKALFIACSRRVDMNIKIALDYRASLTDPRVVAVDWLPEGRFWREVTPTFTEFIGRIGLK